MLFEERASSMPRREGCAGSAEAERKATSGTAQVQDGNELSERGDRIHAMMHSNDFSKAARDEMDVVESLVRMTAELEEDLIGSAKRTKVIKERQFHVIAEGQPVISGHPDRVVTWFADNGHGGSEERALIVDYKTGFLEVDSAEENLQLLCYALGVWQELKIDHIYAKIIMPMSKGHKVVEYNLGALAAGHAHVLAILEACAKENAPRTPSPGACRYCKAAGTAYCTETAGVVDKITRTNLDISMTGLEMAAWLDLAAVASGIIESRQKQFKMLLQENADAIPGYYLKPGNNVRKISDPQKCYEAVQDALSLEQFTACVSVPIGRMENALGQALDLKGKALADEVRRRLGSVIVEDQNAPSLSKMSKALLKEKGLA